MTADHAGVTPTCSNHPGVETRLECSTCGRPICPRCMVATPVGQKCPSCARQSGRARGRPSTLLVVRVLAAASAAGALGGLVLTLAGFRAVLLLSLVYGFLVGSAAKWAAGRRTHTVLGAAAAAGLVLGLVAVVLALGGSPANPVLVLTAVVGGGIAYVRAAGVW